MQQYSGEKPGYLHGCLELGKCYLSHARFDQAKKIFLSICSLAPNSSSWLGAGMAYYKEGDMQKAEAALVEGNVLDPWNFKIWAYLTLVCLSTNRMDEAEFSFQQSLKSNIFPPLLLDVAAAFSEKRNFRLAETALQKACEEVNVEIGVMLIGETKSWQEKLDSVKILLKSTPDMQNATCRQQPFCTENISYIHSEESNVPLSLGAQKMSFVQNE